MRSSVPGSYLFVKDCESLVVRIILLRTGTGERKVVLKVGLKRQRKEEVYKEILTLQYLPISSAPLLSLLKFPSRSCRVKDRRKYLSLIFFLLRRPSLQLYV